MVKNSLLVDVTFQPTGCKITYSTFCDLSVRNT